MHDSLPVWCIHESYWKYVPWNQRKQYAYTKNVPPKFPNKEKFNQNVCWQLVSADSKAEKKISVIVDFRFVYKSWKCKSAQNGDWLSVLHFKCDFKHCRYIYTHTSRIHIYLNKPCTSSVQNWETHACFYNIKWKADGRHWSTEIKWNPPKSYSL